MNVAAVLRAVALVCLAVAVLLVIAAIVKARADLLIEALFYYVIRVLLVKCAADAEADRRQAVSNESVEGE